MLESRRQRFGMVDITPKEAVVREAYAVGKIRLKPATVRLIRDGKVEKGDPISAAEIAAVMAAKNTSGLLPLCHPLPITNVRATSTLLDDGLEAEVYVKATARTGVEMEALVGASTFLLTVWDLVKQYEKDDDGQYPSTQIEYIRVKRKIKGGRRDERDSA